MLKSQAKLLDGQYLHPDEWRIGENITRDRSNFKDSSFPGCDYRIPAGYPINYNLAINIAITGRKSHDVGYDRYKTRVKIEFVGDGEPSTFTSGWIYTDYPLI